jgi:hypothetical protein
LLYASTADIGAGSTGGIWWSVQPNGLPDGYGIASSKSGGQVAERKSHPVPADQARVLNVQFANISRAIARALAEPQTAKLLHAKAMQRFDGGTNVLWRHLNNEQALGRGVTGWASLLVEKNLNGSAAELGSPEALQAIIEKVEGKFAASLHLSWHNAEHWDGKTAPVVVFTPFDQDPEKAPFLPGFDAEGRSYQVTGQFAKGRPVVILTISERTDARGQLREGLVILNRAEDGELSIAVLQSGPIKIHPEKLQINTISLPFAASWYDGWFGTANGIELQAKAAYPGGSSLGFKNFTITSTSLPGSIPTEEWIQTNQYSSATQIEWIEQDETRGEWALGADDPLETHQVYRGDNTVGYNPMVRYIW